MTENGTHGSLTASQSMDSVHAASTAPECDEGFETSLLKVTSKNGKTATPVGFVTFSSRANAEVAKTELQGVKFDPDLHQCIRLEFAKSNTKVSKPKQLSPPIAALPTSNTFLHPITGQELHLAAAHSLLQAGGGAAEQLLPASALHAYAELAAHPGGAATAIPAHHLTYHQLAAAANAAAAAAHHHSAPSVLHHVNGLGGYVSQLPITSLTAAHPLFSGYSAVIPSTAALASPCAVTTAASFHNGPCSTLFVANLGQLTTEQELKEIFGSFPGFYRVRLHNKGGSPVAFVEYQDLRQATQAMTSLQGFVLLSSERGGLRIEYAKNKMGELSTLKAEELLLQPRLFSVISA